MPVLTMRMCGGVEKNHQLIIYLSSADNCPMCSLLGVTNKPVVSEQHSVPNSQTDSEVCIDCGSLMVRTGACFTCPSCGRAGSCG